MANGPLYLTHMHADAAIQSIKVILWNKHYRKKEKHETTFI